MKYKSKLKISTCIIVHLHWQAANTPEGQDVHDQAERILLLIQSLLFFVDYQ